MSGTTIALIAGGVLAAGGFAWWLYSSKKAGAEDAQTIQTGASTSTDATAHAATTTETAPSTGTERKKPMAFGTKNAPVKSVTTDTTKSGRRGMGVKRGGSK
jgi:hypothetical protein